MALKLITAATAPVVSLARAKLHCRIDGSDEDTLITDLVNAASAHIEVVTGRALAAQTWELWLDGFADEMRLPLGPVQSVSAVEYVDAAGATQVLAGTVWQADLVSDPARIVRRSGQVWPAVSDAANVVCLRFVAGYAACPAPLQQAVLLLAGHWYRNREAVNIGNIVNELPIGVENLIAGYRSFLW